MSFSVYYSTTASRYCPVFSVCTDDFPSWHHWYQYYFYCKVTSILPLRRRDAVPALPLGNGEACTAPSAQGRVSSSLARRCVVSTRRGYRRTLGSPSLL